MFFFTKFFVNKDKWNHAITLIGMWQPKVSPARKGELPTTRKGEVPSTMKGGVPAKKGSQKGRLWVLRAPRDNSNIVCHEEGCDRLAWAICYICERWTCPYHVWRDEGIGTGGRLYWVCM